MAFETEEEETLSTTQTKPSIFGQRLKAAMELREIKAYPLGNKSGIDPSTIYNFVNGESEWPNGYTLRQLSSELNISADYLLGLNELPER